jgi:hypothetical protein
MYRLQQRFHMDSRGADIFSGQAASESAKKVQGLQTSKE